MKPGNIHTSRTAGRITPPAIALFGLLAGFSSAQTVENFSPSLPPVPKTAPTSPEAKPAPEIPVTPTNTPSRFVGEADLDAYVKTVAANFLINSQVTDPFGQYQDPSKRPVIKPKPNKSRLRRQQIKKTPFSDIVRLLKITTVMPGERKFLIGTRSISLGDKFPISFRGKNILVEVTGVNARQIEFRNVETLETGTISLNLMPPGMTSGTGSISAPGMIPQNANTPIQLESSEL